ncbi:lipopolysaccharide biosynthesis protein [Mucilaginibacter limnophilus]|uniref:Lipopolysaccharide biosynthesis protein n=1 Tax=Mucilaginibacter limnophilus TaxID=1932778 RepID=A0A3S2X0Q1_9SPHI|nr:oligosaccharide flippase family protein [Mucilaginibacter limnophilus]RVU02710.1 lipopolysaccharide biosynthesis protein [Mucilaginibacter limnophilus]
MLQKILTLIKNKHFLSLAGNIIMSGLGMLTTALIYRALKDDDIVGVWVLFQTTVLFVDTFRSGLLTTAFIKFYSGTTGQRSAEVVGATWYIAMAITGGLIILNLPVLFFLDHFSGGYILFFKYFGATYILSLPWFIASCVLQGEQRFDRLLYVRMVNQGSFVLFVVILMIMQKGSVLNVLYAYLLSHALTSLYTLVMGWCRLDTIKHRTKAAVSEIFNFGKFSVGTTLSSNMFRFSDLFIINAMLGTGAVAIYNLGQTLMQLVEIPLRSFAATGMPSLAAAYNQNSRSEVIYIMKKYIGLLTVILFPAAIIAVLLADVPIYIMGGGKYVGTEAANVFRLFMTFALLYPADRFFALTLDVIHKPKINFYKVLIMLAANIIFDVLGVLLFKNIYGITLATLAPTLIGTTIGYYALKRYHNFSFFSVYSLGISEAKVYINQLKQKFKR